MTTDEKLAALRQKMAKHHLDAYYVNTADPHQSEYISDYFRDRAWLTGFTGSAGEALITKDQAFLWADGRYFIQAEKQIAGSEFRLMKKDTPGYPSLLEWLSDHLAPKSTVGTNASSISESFFEKASEKLKDHEISLIADTSLINCLWTDRPALPTDPIFPHDIRFTGQTAAQKVSRIRELMKQDRVEAFVIAGLDDIAWLYNYRGNDVLDNPVALAFALITETKAFLFIDPVKVNEAMHQHFKENDIEVLDYDQIGDQLSHLSVSRLALDKNRINRQLFRSIPSSVTIVDKTAYTTMEKACLNPVELANQKACYIRDSAIVTRYLFWVKDQIQKGVDLDEWTGSCYLHDMRVQDPLFIEDSFSCISAYGANAAMMHYGPSEEKSSPLQPKGFYLCDCGGQYHDGTTDITRTIALGDLTPEEKTDYTYTLKSHIGLADAIFLEGSTGYYLDILAREPLWRHYSDYKCGTGHAVGYVLGVHEGPQRISKAVNTVPLKPGMIVTDEPGVYKEGKHGIRLENDLVVVLDRLVEPDQFLRFEVLSLVPFDREAIDVSLLSDQELDWVNTYHQKIYDQIKDLMVTEGEKKALKEACAPLAR